MLLTILWSSTAQFCNCENTFIKLFKALRQPASLEVVDLTSKLLVYSPGHRMTALEALTHQFFDELRDPKTRLRNGQELPPLFNFTPEGLHILHICVYNGAAFSLSLFIQRIWYWLMRNSIS